ELATLGLIDPVRTRMHAAQAAGCGPIVTMIKQGTETLVPVRPNTIAKSLAMGNPADGVYAYRVVKESGGAAEHATDEEILDAMALLARSEGIFTETAGGVTLAVTKKLIEQGVIPRDEPIVVCITGNGLKTVEAVEGRLPEAGRIRPSLGAVDRALADLKTLTRAGRPFYPAEEENPMPVLVRIPTPLRRVTNGVAEAKGTGQDVAALIDDLERQFPGIRERLVEESGE